MKSGRFQLNRRRRGATLVFVVAFLALGLSLGVSFLYFATNHAAQMRLYREAAQGGRAANVNQGTLGSNDESPPQPYDIANTALGQLIYTDYILLFQSAGLILLVAMIGAIVLTLRSREGVRRQVIAQQIGRRRELSVEVRKVPTRGGVS